MYRTAGEEILFITWIYSNQSFLNVRMMVESLRRFGGNFSQSPLWIFVPESEFIANRELIGEKVEIKTLKTPGKVRDYYYAHKVYACAQAEEIAGPDFQSLVWVSPEILFVNPPVSFELGKNFQAAFRPVHIQNVGLRVDETLDVFWNGVLKRAGIEDINMEVESFVDQKRLRAYYNSAAFGLDPNMGLCRRWFEIFEELVIDSEFQRGACQDEWHRVFLHQVILSVLVAAEVGDQRLRLLTPDYIYPYNLHADVTVNRRARSLDELVCLYYEGRSLNPDFMTDIEVPDPYRSWLADLN